MEILILNGSPRKNGVTSSMIKEFKNEASKHIINVINAFDINVNDCLACECCHKNGSGKCIQNDDMHLVYEKLESADMLILASPIYYHNITGKLKCIIDRFYQNMGPFCHSKLSKVAMFLASGDDDMYVGARFSFLGDFVDYLGLENMGVFCASDKNKETILNQVKEFARSIKDDHNLRYALNNRYSMPKIGYGTARLTGDTCIESVENAIKAGYRLIDTAQMYHNEKEVGIAIKNSKINRRHLFVTSKLYSTSRSYELAKKAIDESLNNLQLDYIDLMLIHEPYDEAPEMYKALEEAYKAGKLKAIGISNFNKERYLEFIKQIEIIPMVNQVECHNYNDREELRKCLESHGTIMESWSTFTALKKNVFDEPILKEIANNHGKNVSQIILNYFISKNIVVIPKSKSFERMKENLQVFDFELSEEENKRIKELNEDISLFNWYDN